MLSIYEAQIVFENYMVDTLISLKNWSNLSSIQGGRNGKRERRN